MIVTYLKQKQEQFPSSDVYNFMDKNFTQQWNWVSLHPGWDHLMMGLERGEFESGEFILIFSDAQSLEWRSDKFAGVECSSDIFCYTFVS